MKVRVMNGFFRAAAQAFFGLWLALIALAAGPGTNGVAFGGDKSSGSATAQGADDAQSAGTKDDSKSTADDKAAGKQTTEESPTAKAAKAQTPAEREAARQREEEEFEFYKSLADTIDQVERNYVKPIDRRELMEAAIKGVLTKLDPYSSYIDPKEISGFRTAVESQFGGIGIQITVDDGQIRVTSPLVGTPAYRAGIQAGDRILKIGDETTRGMSPDDAAKLLKGEPGTPVSMTVRHAHSGKEETLSMKREIIHIDTVLGDSRLDDDSWNFMLDPEQKIGYIRVTAFSRDTAADLKKSLEELKKQKMRGLVLDLRFNPGGLLTSAVDVCNMFIDEGRIVSTNGRNTPERIWDATPGTKFLGFPMVVLVNRYSASASEIVSACLQDHNRAVVIGERTWGKGSVQNVIELEEGKSALKLTTATYTRPNGHNIHRFPDAKDTDEWGVKPNDGLDLRLTDDDMVELQVDRRQRDIVHDHLHHAENLVAKADGAAEHAEARSGKVADSHAHDGVQPTDAAADKADKSAGAGDKKPTPVPFGSSNGGAGNSSKSAGTAASGSAGASRVPKFVDRQLQRGLEYLSSELARAQ